jgi:hypothetical protein
LKKLDCEDMAKKQDLHNRKFPYEVNDHYWLGSINTLYTGAKYSSTKEQKTVLSNYIFINAT